MRRLPVLALAAVGGLLTGALVTLSLDAPAQEPSGDEATASDALPEAPVEPAPLGAATDRVLLAWTSGGLPTGLASEVAALPRVTAVTSVAGGRVDLVASATSTGTPVDELAPGWAIPLDAFAIAPDSYAAFVPAADRPTVESLRGGTALLGATSARLRRLDAGDRVTLAPDLTLTVAGVVDDVAVGGAELVVAHEDADRLDLATPRFLLVAYRGDRAEIEGAIRDLVGVEVRVRAPGETPFLRHGDAVLPQALLKERFGEFAYQPPAGDRAFAQDPAWVEAHLAEAEVPILGRVRCHRGVVAQLRGALQELVDRGLAHLVDPDGYAGCHNPRLISPGGMPSRHAWGIAFDLNATANPTGRSSVQDPRLVDTLAQWGLTWGGFWLVPDPMHFEYLGPPSPDPAKVTTPD